MSSLIHLLPLRARRHLFAVVMVSAITAVQIAVMIVVGDAGGEEALRVFIFPLFTLTWIVQRIIDVVVPAPSGAIEPSSMYLTEQQGLMVMVGCAAAHFAFWYWVALRLPAWLRRPQPEGDMPGGGKFALSIVAITLAGVTAFLLRTYAYPRHIGDLYLDGIGLFWFAIPGVCIHPLVRHFPLTRRSIPRLLLLTLVCLAASVVRLYLVHSSSLGDGFDRGIAAAWIAGMTLALLAGIGWLREDRRITIVYHLVLTTWFFAAAFPYMGG